MKLSQSRLRIDPKRFLENKEKELKRKIKELNKSGVVVPISGGLDSSVVASLCVRSLGKEKVKGIILPEREGDHDAKVYAKLLAEELGIETKKIDMTDALSGMGVYHFVLSLIPSRFLKKIAVHKYLSKKRNIFIECMKGKGDKIVRKGYAKVNTKQRARMMFTYQFAEENNLLVVGSANKTESLTGLFVRGGIDDVSDFMPLRDLYRSNILQLAHHLDVPDEICERAPNPDIIPGIEDKYKDFLGVDSNEVDLILFGLEKRMSVDRISKEVGVSKNKIITLNKIRKRKFG